MTHNLTKICGRKKREKSSYLINWPFLLSIFFQVCLSAKMQNETDLIFPQYIWRWCDSMQLTLFQWHTFWTKHAITHTGIKLILKEHSCLYAAAISRDISITISCYCIVKNTHYMKYCSNSIFCISKQIKRNCVV